MSYSVPNRNVRFSVVIGRGHVRVRVVRAGVTPGTDAQDRRDGAGSEVIGTHEKPSGLAVGGFLVGVEGISLVEFQSGGLGLFDRAPGVVCPAFSPRTKPGSWSYLSGRTPEDLAAFHSGMLL